MELVRKKKRKQKNNNFAFFFYDGAEELYSITEDLK